MEFPILVALSLIAWSPCLSGAVVLGNLGADGNGGINGVVDVGGSTDWDSHSFNTGSSSLLSLQSITVGLELSTGGPSTLTMRLYADNAGPGIGPHLVVSRT